MNPIFQAVISIIFILKRTCPKYKTMLYLREKEGNLYLANSAELMCLHVNSLFDNHKSYIGKAFIPLGRHGTYCR